jgi:anaphase-promoting complex subunit 2
MLQSIGEPIRRYLRQRHDTVRCVVTMLTSDGDLKEALRQPAALIGHDDDIETDEIASAWQPDPINADPSQSASERQSSDIIAILVGIFGTNELFVNEYRTLLAARYTCSFP